MTPRKMKPRKRIKKTIPGVVYARWRKEGVLEFFKGLQAQILKTVTSSALLLMMKDKITATTWILILAIRTLFCHKGWIEKSIKIAVCPKGQASAKTFVSLSVLKDFSSRQVM